MIGAARQIVSGIGRREMISGLKASVAVTAMAMFLPGGAMAQTAQQGGAQRCAGLAETMAARWPQAGTRLLSSRFQPAGPAATPPGMPAAMAGPPTQLPAHCELIGAMNERTGVDGQRYAIRFHLRLPENWNGRFLMQGGGGTNGELGDAIGRVGSSAPPALAQGFAVLSQDSGHDNATNSVLEKGGATAFGFDPQARADYGGTSLKATTLAARAIIRAFYGADPRHSYFFGCSKGGQEGMMLAQRYPELYDGIVAGAPGFSLPRAAIGEAWNTQSFAAVARSMGQTVSAASIAASFSDRDFDLVGKAILAACDGDDGAQDGQVNDHRRCTSEKVLPRLRAQACTAAKAEGCLSTSQIDALLRIHEGARDSKGKQVYAGFPWDAGWADMGWRIWMTGSADGRIPSINLAMGAPALASIFTTPPTALGASPQAVLDYVLGFDLDRDAARVDAVASPFTRSAWQDIAARSSDLDGFRKRGGRLIVPHGVSDPVFSVNDTTQWFEEVDMRYDGQAASFVRVFPVPGMGHCQGGPATDQYDAFGAIIDWVEKGQEPEQLHAKAGPRSPWPGRERPICPFPKIARPSSEGDRFACAAP